MENNGADKSSNGAEKAFDQTGALRIFDSGEEGVALIPLQEVIQHLSTFFWAAIFFGVLMVSVGSLISLLATDYSNSPVIYVMSMFLVSYFIFAVVFIVQGFT